MAKVTDLNGCFVRVNGDVELIKNIIEFTGNGVTTSGLSNPRAEDIFFRGDPGWLISDFVKMKPTSKFKEIYFNGGEFFDCPTVSINQIDPVSMAFDIVGDSGATEEDVLWRKFGSTVEFFANPDFEHCGVMSNWIDGDDLFVIGYRQVWGNVMAVVQNMRTQNCSAIKIECLRKPETETEKKTRELAEEVNRICFDLFGTPAFDCNQDIIDTVEKFIVNGYKKVD